MEIRSTRSFNAIPATLIRGVFNLHISNLIWKIYCKYLIHAFIYSFFPLFLTTVKFLVAKPTYLPSYPCYVSSVTEGGKVKQDAIR